MSESKIDKNAVKILAVRSALLFPIDRWSGFRPIASSDPVLTTSVLNIINLAGEYKVRGPLETDPSYKQIIPQLLWVVDNKVFVHKIPETGHEARLHKQLPIFLGGHIEESDGTLEDATWREFFEEAGFPEDTDRSLFSKQFIGLVNDESNEVSSVHLGLVSIIRGGGDLPREGKDDGVTEGQFLSPAEIWAEPNLTYWSRLAWPALQDLL